MNTYLTYGAIILAIFCFCSCDEAKADAKNNTGSEARTVKVGSEIEHEIVSLNPSQLVMWVQDEQNGLFKSKTIGDLNFSIQHKPSNYIICQEERNDSIKQRTFEQKIKELDGLEYYDLNISVIDGKQELLKYNLNNVAEFDKRTRYYSFDMQKDIMMLVDQDSISCSLYHFERAFDNNSKNLFLLGFPKSKSSSDRTIILTDKIFGKGIVKFNFSAKVLFNIPKLKTR
jgi:hypothetical protein